MLPPGIVERITSRLRVCERFYAKASVIIKPTGKTELTRCGRSAVPSIQLLRMSTYVTEPQAVMLLSVLYTA